MEIADWRRKIDEIDGKLVELLGERARVAKEIGHLKARANLPIVEPERAQAVFDRIENLNPGTLPKGGLTRIYQGIMEVMLEIQRRQR
jgi:chorismate mutase / prephenate dehydratase